MNKFKEKQIIIIPNIAKSKVNVLLLDFDMNAKCGQSPPLI